MPPALFPARPRLATLFLTDNHAGREKDQKTPTLHNSKL